MMKSLQKVQFLTQLRYPSIAKLEILSRGAGDRLPFGELTFKLVDFQEVIP